MALLAAAPLLFSTDSGPVHVANAVGTPVIVCFGPGNEAVTGPYYPQNAAVVRAPGPIPCAGLPPQPLPLRAAPPCLTGLDDARLVAIAAEMLNVKC